MKVIDLLNKIENDEIEDGTIFEVIGDFFYKLIVIDKKLYCINERTKQLEILESKYIGRFDNRQYKIIELSNKIGDKKIFEKLENYISCGWNGTCKDLKREDLYNDLVNIGNKINEIIDYLEEKEQC